MVGYCIMHIYYYIILCTHTHTHQQELMAIIHPRQRQNFSHFLVFVQRCHSRWAHYVMLYFKGKCFLKLLGGKTIKEARAAEEKMSVIYFFN